MENSYSFHDWEHLQSPISSLYCRATVQASITPTEMQQPRRYSRIFSLCIHLQLHITIIHDDNFIPHIPKWNFVRFSRINWNDHLTFGAELNESFDFVKQNKPSLKQALLITGTVTYSTFAGVRLSFFQWS